MAEAADARLGRVRSPDGSRAYGRRSRFVPRKVGLPSPLTDSAASCNASDDSSEAKGVSKVPRDERKIHNQALFRSVNERIAELSAKFGEQGDAGLLSFICECPQIGCRAFVRAPLEAYDRVRDDPALFLVLKGHEDGCESGRGRSRRLSDCRCRRAGNEPPAQRACHGLNREHPAAATIGRRSHPRGQHARLGQRPVA